MNVLNDARFSGIKPFGKKIWLSSPTMHGDEKKWANDAFDTNWVSTVGENLEAIERQIPEFIGCKYGVALSSGTAALHLATKLAGEKIYGRSEVKNGTLQGSKVFCSDLTFDASVNPIAYENGEAVFIDSENETWNMCPEALEKAFELFPDTKLIVLVHLFGTPAKAREIKEIARRHGALIVEDAAESLGAKYYLDGEWVKAGSLGDFNCISFNGNKIITGSTGGMFLTNDKEDADKIKKWSTQSREKTPWYQHEELGYNYRMSNIIAGVIRGQLPYLQEHVSQKKEIYERYKKGLSDLPVKMNPFIADKCAPNAWLSCMTIDQEAMCRIDSLERMDVYQTERGKTCPMEILDTLAAFNVEGRPIWKPMHLQPIYRKHEFITKDGRVKAEGSHDGSVGTDLYRRGVCLPSDNKMTSEQQDRIIEIIHRCFR